MLTKMLNLSRQKRIPPAQLLADQAETSTAQQQTGEKKGFFAAKMEESKIKAKRRTEQKMIRRRVKEEEKRRRKELRSDPPRTYVIGTEAFVTSRKSDFDYDVSENKYGNGVMKHAPEKMKTKIVQI